VKHHGPSARGQLPFPGCPDRLLNVREAANLLSLRPRTLYKLSYERRLPVVKVGRATRFRLSSLVRLIEEWERPASRPLRLPDGV
jgi:excisionase family DNA binding protein